MLICRLGLYKEYVNLSIKIMRKYILILLLVLFFSGQVSAEILFCQKMKGVMINEQGELIKIPLDSESIIQIDEENATVTTDEDKVNYRVILNTESVIHFSNITPIVFEIFSFYPKTGKLFYSKHSQMGYNSQYSTLCIRVEDN